MNVYFTTVINNNNNKYYLTYSVSETSGLIEKCASGKTNISVNK